MTLSLQEISDRLEINELLVRYTYAIDMRRWDELDEIFTPDAVIDYTEMGGTRGGLAETKAFLHKALRHYTRFQHLVASTALELDGDVARGRTICHNPMISTTAEGKEHVMFCGLWYRDTFVRTSDGWRISERYEEKGYFHNAPWET